jgi:alpha-1,2-mannosyltransferase
LAVGPAVPAAVVAWVVAAAALFPTHALTGVHSYTGTGYDDGVYLGASVRLLHGSLPWLDYDLLHPPGAVLLGVPFAALGELTTASVGLAVARIVTVVVAGINVILAGSVVRSRGRTAVFVTASLFALMPTSYAATQTLLLEPYLVLFCLVGLTVLTTGDGEIATGRRLVLAGAMVGGAVSVKIFGVLVAATVIVGLFPRWRVMRDWALGVILGAVVVTLPLAIAAPVHFVRDVVWVQLARGDRDHGVGFRDRLPVVLGLEALPDPSADDRALWVLVAVGVVVAAGVVVDLCRRRLTRLYVISVVVAAATFVGMAQPRQFFDHYAYFVVAVLVLPTGLSVAALVDALSAPLRRRGGFHRSWWPSVAACCALVLAGLVVVPGAVGRSYDYNAASADPGPLIRSLVPSGSCVATDLSTALLVADRMNASRSCDVPLDPYAVWFTENDLVPAHTPPPYQLAFVERWRTWLEEADYAVLSVQFSDFVPWTPELVAWFNAHYVLVGSGPWTYIYLRLPVG